MTIYRGPGGAGDATNDAIVNAVAAYATSAASSADNAANSASAASTSATNASTSATNAASSASQAATSESNSAASASTASTQASTATTQANNAAASATAASSSAASASTYASNAASSASTATSKAAEAETYAIRAETAETNAETAYSNTLGIFGDATDVANAVAAASTSATNAANSATTAASSATAASGSATTAGNYASAALNSANTANAEASEAQSAANTAVAALQSAQAIYGGLDDVTTAVNEAEDWATQSANSATASSASSSAAQTSANAAATSATDAANSATQSAASAASAAAIVTGVASNRASIRPSLLLDFANSKTLDPRISYARASAGTYTDVFGIVKTAASGVVRFTHEPTTGESLGMIIEPQRTNLVLESAGFDKQNLFTYSGTFDNAAWTKTRSAVTSGQADPFGGTGAFKLTEDTSTNTHAITATPTVGNAVPAVLSIYAKAGERSWIAIANNTTTTTIAYFDLANGVVGTLSGSTPPTNATITSVGGGWYRCSFKYTSPSTSPQCQIYTATADNTISYTGTTGSGIYIYGAQLERSYGTTPSAYYATTSTTWQPWFATSTTIAANAGTSPDGTNSAYKVVAVSGQTLNNAANYIRTEVITTVVSTVYTTSVYAKASGYSVLNLRLGNSTTLGGNLALARFNLSTGAVISVTAGYNAQIQSVGNGWYRCSITGTAGTTTSYTGIWNDNSTATTANGTDGILLWGFQVEQADSASTYIPTTTAQVTRAADVLSLADSGWLNQTEGTFYVDRKLRAVNDNQTLFSLDNGTSDIKVRTVQGTNTVNLLTYSEQFDAAAWVKSSASILSNVIIAPDNTTTADMLIPDTTLTPNHYNTQSYAGWTSGTTYTLTAYAKAGGYNYLRLSLPATAFGIITSQVFDLANGVLGTGSTNTPTSTITSIGNGWYCCSVTKAATVTASGSVAVYSLSADSTAGFTGNGTSGIYIWGAQLEASSSASTYEPNPKYLTSYEIGSDGLIQTAPYASADLPNLYPRMVFGYKANDATFYRGGSSVGTDTSVTLPTSMNRLVIGGSAINSGREINGTIKRIAYFPKRIADIEQSGETS